MLYPSIISLSVVVLIFSSVFYITTNSVPYIELMQEGREKKKLVKLAVLNKALEGATIKNAYSG
jgi:hypothetical protein